MATVNEKMTAIADAIRAKTGGTKPLYLDDMASGVGEVFEAGKQAEYNSLWDVVSDNQSRIHYYRGFSFWGAEYIRPPFKIVPKTRQGHHYLFAECKKLLKVEKEYFDLSQIPELSQTNGQSGHMRIFSGCANLVEVEDVGIQAAAYDGVFYDCLKLEKIAVVRSQEDTIFNSNTFGYCSKLTDLTIEGVIGTSIVFNRSPLSVASLKSIVKHLKPYYGTDKEFTCTLTVKASAWQALETAGFTDEDYRWIADVWGGNPTIVESWDQLMGGWLGWKLSLAA